MFSMGPTHNNNIHSNKTSTPLLLDSVEGTNSYDAVIEVGGVTVTTLPSNPGRTISSPGLTDEYRTWSDSTEAFHQAIFHTIVYFTVGIVGYSFLLPTRWSIVDSVYFSVVIFTTVGYGDLSPDSSASGMIFTMLFALYGIVILGIFLGILGNMAIERQQHLKDERLAGTKKSMLDAFKDAFKEDDDDSAILAFEESSEGPEHLSFVRNICQTVIGQFRPIATLLLLAVPIFLLEKWDFVKGLYWVIVTGTTIGLGDEHPESEWSKVICIFYIPLVVAFAGTLLGRIATFYVDKRNDDVEAEFFARAMTANDLQKMDVDGNAKVSELEFMVYMLTTMQKVDPSDIQEISELFRKIDKDNNGSITTEDLGFISERTECLQRRSAMNQSNSNRMIGHYFRSSWGSSNTPA